MLGNYVTKYLGQKCKSSQENDRSGGTIYKIIPITRADYDISNLERESLKKFLKNLSPNDVVINCAGVIPQSGKNDYLKVNTMFPTILSQICLENGAHLIHVSTDCVFTGKNGGYDENSVHDEIGPYGLSKSLGENRDSTIIRTSIIGEENYNKKSLLEWVKANRNGNINGYVNHFWNGVTCLQLSKIIEQIIREGDFWFGVRHLFSPSSVSKYELVCMINDIYDLNITVNPLQTPTSVDKTLKTIYVNEFNIPCLQDQIKEMKDFSI